MNADGSLAVRMLASRTRRARGLSLYVLVVVHRAEVALVVIRLQVCSKAARYCVHIQNNGK